MDGATRPPEWPQLSWQIGVEVELLAPRGSSRLALAERLAATAEGAVGRYFHAQTEPSLAPGLAVFDTLTLGFRVTDHAGDWLASCVDDLTLEVDLDREAPPVAGWYRVLSDDRRLLNLTRHLASAEDELGDVMAAVASVFGTTVERFDEGRMRVCDAAGAPVLLAAPLPGERERPCELITPPLAEDHGTRLDALLAPARDMGFSVPTEAAVHLHFDATALRTPLAVRNLVRLWRTWGATLKTLLRTNPACRQLGDWPPALAELVEGRGWLALPWPEAQAALAEVGLRKFCDLNLVHLGMASPVKNTIELRVLPGSLDTREILMAAALFEGVLRRAIDPAPVERAQRRKFRRRQAAALLRSLPLSADVLRYWSVEVEAVG